MKTTRSTTKTTKTTAEPVVYRIGCWHEDAPIKAGSYRLLIAAGDSFGPRFVGGDTGVELATANRFIVFTSEEDARGCFRTLPAGLEVEYHRFDGEVWRTAGAGVVQGVA